MKATFIVIGSSCISLISLGQEIDSREEHKEYRINQHKLDMNQGGVGVSFYKPSLGSIVTSQKPWTEISLLSDIVEFRLGVGQVDVNGTIPYGYTGTLNVSSRQFGYHFYTGINYPLPFLTLGAQHSPSKVFRGHITLAGGFGYFNMTDSTMYSQKRTAQIGYLGICPGYRIRFPYGSIEANLHMNLGLSTGSQKDYFGGSGIYPSITLRIDALKWKYDPSIVTVQGAAAAVSNVKSETKYTGSGTESGTRVDYYTTTTTGDVHVSNFNVGIQDIGPHMGFGPKFSYMSPKRSPYIPLSRMLGVVFEGRGGPYDFGVTLEGGRVGHGGELIVKDEDEHKYRRKLDKRTTTGQGEISTINLYTQIGFDISPAFLVPFGIVIDKGEATSFFSITAGLNFGMHLSFGQEFLDPVASRADYDAKLAADGGESKEKFIDPSKAKSGYLGGGYISAQVGALNFKITNYRYYGAPFASTTMLSLAYRFPFLTRK